MGELFAGRFQYCLSVKRSAKERNMKSMDGQRGKTHFGFRLPTIFVAELQDQLHRPRRYVGVVLQHRFLNLLRPNALLLAIARRKLERPLGIVERDHAEADRLARKMLDQH